LELLAAFEELDPTVAIGTRARKRTVEDLVDLGRQDTKHLATVVATGPAAALLRHWLRGTHRERSHLALLLQVNNLADFSQRLDLLRTIQQSILQRLILPESLAQELAEALAAEAFQVLFGHHHPKLSEGRVTKLSSFINPDYN